MTSEIAAFRKAVLGYYETSGRNTLPWRLNAAPWPVLVSEFMLQQTQIERVIPYWKRWMGLWPEPGDLADAPLADALREWNGLGYNRRGRFLWECARRIAGEYGGVVPDTPEKLITLPGVGSYTAGAVACFAYDYPAVFIETNIRAALIHFFFADRERVHDTELVGILEESLCGEDNPRVWYWALMDYGAALKKAAPNPNRRSAHYTRQSRFEGSFRQWRGAILRSLVAEGPASANNLAERTGIEPDRLYDALAALEKDFMVACDGGVYSAG
ncbi:MAG: A/G-specific adenine glycosylase [Spirochaetaceae bacterium]|jgi:A/G-specific adenine glycosylase|nr:A/G-specific adenine glycosylase [Spirochaetaceae bacterium]